MATQTHSTYIVVVTNGLRWIKYHTVSVAALAGVLAECRAMEADVQCVPVEEFPAYEVVEMYPTNKKLRGKQKFKFLASDAGDLGTCTWVEEA